MNTKPTSLPDVVVITPRVFSDPRGYFFESFNAAAFQKVGLPTTFVQDNQSYSQQGTLRGLHFQKGGHAQGKLVRVLQGRIFDVAVDIRPDSPSYKHWVGVFLDDQDHQMVYVPPGFAHGFYVTSAHAVVSYKCTTPYHPSSEGGLRWDDPVLGIQWPLVPGVEVRVSDKDKIWEWL